MPELMTALPTLAHIQPPAASVLTVEEALARVPHAYAPATVKGWHTAVDPFKPGRKRRGSPRPMPLAPAVVAAFVDAQAAAGRKPGSVKTYVAALDWGHKLLDLPAPGAHRDVKLAIKSMARAAAHQGVHQRQAVPLRRAKIDSVLAEPPAKREGAPDLAALRDKALLAVAYDSLARASELVALQVEDVEPGSVTIWRSKTDQTGEGSVRYLAPDSWGHVAAWIKAAKLRPTDPLFRPLGPAAKGRPHGGPGRGEGHQAAGRGALQRTLDSGRRGCRNARGRSPHGRDSPERVAGPATRCRALHAQGRSPGERCGDPGTAAGAG
jgi:integrase